MLTDGGKQPLMLPGWYRRDALAPKFTQHMVYQVLTYDSHTLSLEISSGWSEERYSQGFENCYWREIWRRGCTRCHFVFFSAKLRFLWDCCKKTHSLPIPEVHFQNQETNIVDMQGFQNNGRKLTLLSSMIRNVESESVLRSPLLSCDILR